MKQKLNKSLSIGIVGAGEIVSKVHLPVLLAIEDISVQWITDLNLKKAQSLAYAYQIPNYISSNNINKLPYSDIVLIAIPFGVREPYYNLLKECELAVYVEKPFAKSLEQHEKLCSYFPPNKLACGFQRRSWGPTLLVKNLIEKNTLGKLNTIKFGLGNPAGFTGLASSFSDLKLSGGGILFDTGIHGIDTIFFCADAKSFQLNSVKLIMKNGFDIHSEAKFTIKNNMDETINCEILISSVQETINQLEFTFDNAVTTYSLFDTEGTIQLKSLNKNDNNISSLNIDKSKMIYPLSSFQTFYEHWSMFINGINTNQMNRTLASESKLTTQLVEAIYKEGIK